MSIFSNDYLPWQKIASALILSKKADILILSGGFGSGKTAANVQIMRELMYSRSMIGLSIGYANPVIVDILLPTIEEEIPGQYISTIKRSAPHSFRFQLNPNFRSVLLTRTVQYDHEVAKRLKSINADFLHLLEATELPEKAYTYGVSRLRASGESAYYPVLIETNPGSKEHWVYRNFIKDSAEVKRADDNSWWITRKYIENNACYTIHTTTFANPYFPKDIIDQMKSSYSDAEFQRLVLGDWNALEGRVWEKYFTFAHPKEDMVGYASRYDRVFLGLDPGQDHEMAVSFIGQKGSAYEVFDEIYLRMKSINTILELILEKLQSWGFDINNRRFDIYLEPSGFGLTWRTELLQRKICLYPISSTHKGTDPVLYRVSRLGELIRTKRLTFSDFCINHIRDLEQTVYAKSIGQKERVDKSAYDPHAMDACGYAMIKEVF